MIRKGGYILARILAALLLLVFAATVLIQIPSVQTKLVNAVIDKLEEKIQGKIDIGRIEFVPTSGLSIKDISIIDTNPYLKDEYCKGYAPKDTFAVISSLRVTFTPSGIFGALEGKPIRMRRVAIDGGSFNLVIEPSNSEKPGSNINRIFGLEPTGKKPGEKEIFSIQKVVVNDFRFTMTNFAKTKAKKGYSGVGINWEDLDVLATIKGHDMRFDDGRMYGVADLVTLREKSGFHAHNITGSAIVGRGATIIDGLHIVDDFSSISLPNFSMRYTDGFKDFVQQVGIHTDFNRSLVSFQTIKFFAGASMTKNFTVLDVKGGRVDGPVADMDVKNLQFFDNTSKMYGVINHCRIDGLPDIQETVFDFTTNGLYFNPRSLSVFVGNFANGHPLSLPSIIPDKKYEFTGSGKGTLNDLALKIGLDSEIGLINVDGLMANVICPEPIEIGGLVESRNLEVGKFLNTPMIGKADLSTEIGLKIENGAKISIDSLKIRSVETSKHTFEDIEGQAFIDGGRIDAKLILADSGLQGILDAVIDNGRISVNGVIDKAELMNFGIAKESYVISSSVDADIRSLKKDLIDGYFKLDNFKFTNALASKNVGSISLQAYQSEEKQIIDFDAPFADLYFNGVLEHFDASLQVHDKKHILTSILPELYLADGTKLEVSRKDTVRVNANISSPRIAYSDINVKNLEFGIDAVNEHFLMDVKGEQLGLSSSMKLDKPEFRLETDCYKLEEGWLHVKADSSKSFLSFGSQKWVFDNVDVYSKDKKIDIENFTIRNNDQIISARGNIKDSIRVALENLNALVMLDLIESTPETVEKIKESGSTASGYIDYMAATGQITGKLDAASKEHETLTSQFFVDLKKKYLDASAVIQKMNLAMIAPMLQNVFSEMDGSIHGNFKAQGNFNNLKIASDSLSLDKARFKLALTQTGYTLDGPVIVDSGKVKLNNLPIVDDFGGGGKINGYLDFSNLKKMNLDARMKFDDLKLLSIDEESIDSFYGDVTASGMASVRGPFNSLQIFANAETSKKGNIHIPLGGGVNATDGKILRFLQKIEDIDMYELIQSRKTHKKKSNINIKANVVVNPDLTGYVEIDKSRGHILKVSGKGNLTLDMNTAKDQISLGGDFVINQGNYHFVALESVAQRDFAIEPGSMIKLNGKPADTEFDITAVYKLKASLTPLTYDTTSVTSRRTVECRLKLMNNIANPQIGFAIDIPDLDPSVSSVVQSMLNTEEKVQKQFIALLVTGTFLPGEESGISNNTGSAFVFNSISTYVSGQLNTILQSLNIPLDMGLNYQNESGKDVFDVAVSTQLFDNKVIVNGSVGNRPDASSKKSDFVGDIDIEVKLNKKGNIRLKAFSHSADDYTNFLDNTQRNGLGFSFQTELGKAVKEKRMRVIQINDSETEDKKKKKNE